MAEFFLELFSEEIPAGLQKNLRENLLKEFQKFFLEKSIKSKKSFSLSTPNRLVVVFEGLDKEIKIPSEEIRNMILFIIVASQLLGTRFILSSKSNLTNF